MGDARKKAIKETPGTRKVKTSTGANWHKIQEPEKLEFSGTVERSQHYLEQCHQKQRAP